MTKHAVFIGATGQNVGKTTLCLGIIAGLQKRFKDVGFIKPVGQQHVKVDNDTNVDKDAVLFKEHFKLSSKWSDMSPVIIPSGFTKDFLDQKISEADMNKKIKDAYKTISSRHAFTVVEGTGHIGVGSIVNMNNARIAAELELDMVIIASGGLGSAHDELALNIGMCRQYGVKVIGVILNRVINEKRAMIEKYFPKCLAKWDVPLIGCVPYNQLLNTPCLKDFESLFNTTLISGINHRYRHFAGTRLVAGSLDSFKEEYQENELIITPATREDIILGTIEHYKEIKTKPQQAAKGIGLILTGKTAMSSSLLDQIRQFDVPVLYAPLCSYDAMKMITSFIAKIPTHDIVKIEQAISIVEQNVNFDALCQVRL